MSGVSKKIWDKKMQVLFDELLGKVKFNPSIDTDLIQKAFEVANKAHKGQHRASNEPYIIHPLEVAKIVADLNMDTSTIVTALLHDTIEDTSLTYKEIQNCFDTQDKKFRKFSVNVHLDFTGQLLSYYSCWGCSRTPRPLGKQ